MYMYVQTHVHEHVRCTYRCARLHKHVYWYSLQTYVHILLDVIIVQIVVVSEELLLLSMTFSSPGSVFNPSSESGRPRRNSKQSIFLQQSDKSLLVCCSNLG